tara:strand:+ start:1602 stop:2057 length:456 start_codon:yes stop_codon:yes gene_type:complete
MVEQLVDEDEDDNSEDSDEDTITDEMEEERNLQGFRWLFQRVNDETLEGDEDEYNERMEEESFQSGQEKLIYEEQKEQIDYLVQEIKKKNCISYDDLLRAYIGSNCDDYMYNEFSGDMEYKVTSTINAIDTRARNNLPPHLREHWARGVRL